jgi:uncharacterized protein YqjF (DUF2071 family)
MSKTFLKAEWRKLAMANYKVNPDLLKPYLPAHTELDFWNGNCYVSLIGFMFLNTRILGLKIPFHINFEEVNLRFYVRYNDCGAWKRGVVFIKEIVPKSALTIVANTVYNENYETMPMRHRWNTDKNVQTAEYQWKKAGKWHTFKIETDPNPTAILEGSKEEFITEHYWGYTAVGKNKTSEYGVEHPRWNVYKLLSYSIDVDFESVYGSPFKLLQTMQPESVFLAEGSIIEVKAGRKI